MLCAEQAVATHGKNNLFPIIRVNKNWNYVNERDNDVDGKERKQRAHYY